MPFGRDVPIFTDTVLAMGSKASSDHLECTQPFYLYQRHCSEVAALRLLAAYARTYFCTAKSEYLFKEERVERGRGGTLRHEEERAGAAANCSAWKE